MHWRAKQPSQVACFSEDLKCGGAPDTTCRYKTEYITPSIAPGVERGSARRPLLTGWERQPSSIRRALELYFKGNVRETAWSANGLFWAHRYPLQLNWSNHRHRKMPSVYIYKQWHEFIFFFFFFFSSSSSAESGNFRISFLLLGEKVYLLAFYTSCLLSSLQKQNKYLPANNHHIFVKTNITVHLNDHTSNEITFWRC